MPYRRESREGQLVEGDCVRRREGGQRNLEPGAGGQYGVDEEQWRWGSRTLHCLKACMGVESSGFTKCLQN